MEAKIEFKPAFRVLGIMKRGKDGTKFIPPLWDKFFEQYHQKTRNLRKSNAGYGVMRNYDSQTKEFDYLAGACLPSNPRKSVVHPTSSPITLTDR